MSEAQTEKRTMLDVHMHLIPGVDDGAMDMMMALSMMMRAQEQGIDGIFATPHSSAFDWNPREAMESFAQLRDNAARFFPDMKLYLGCEVHCDSGYMDDVVESLRTGRYPTVNGGPYVLMEYFTKIEPEYALACAERMVSAGWIPVIAHMERYKYLRDNMELVDRFRAVGCRIQVNAYSLQEELDEEIRDWARQIVRAEKADFLGTDAHRTYHRPPQAVGGLTWLYENCRAEYAQALSFGNARKLLTDE